MTATTLRGNSTRTAYQPKPVLPAWRDGKPLGAFDAYAVAKAISAFNHPVFLMERGELVKRRISPNAKLLAFILASHVNTKTGQCNPRTATLAAEMGCGLRAVEDAIHLLTNAGMLQVAHGRGNRSSYQLIAPGSEPRESAEPEPRESADLEPRNGAGPTVNYEEELRNRTTTATRARAAEPDSSPSSRTTAAASSETDSHGPHAGDVSTGNEGEQPAPSKPEKNKAELLADYLKENTGKRPRIKSTDAAKIDALVTKHGGDEFWARVAYALADEFWREPTTDSLARFLGGFDEIGRQMAAKADRSVTDDYPETDFGAVRCVRCKNVDRGICDGDMCGDCRRELDWQAAPPDAATLGKTAMRAGLSNYDLACLLASWGFGLDKWAKTDEPMQAIYVHDFLEEKSRPVPEWLIEYIANDESGEREPAECAA